MWCVSVGEVNQREIKRVGEGREAREGGAGRDGERVRERESEGKLMLLYLAQLASPVYNC